MINDNNDDKKGEGEKEKRQEGKTKSMPSKNGFHY
jgi:hypothetical protein